MKETKDGGADVAIPDRYARRHRALADQSRLALLRLLELSNQPLDVYALAEGVGLHVNTVRWHLGVLVDAGLVIERRAGAGGRGRPRHVYQVVPGGLDSQLGGLRLLAEVLVGALAEGAALEVVEEAGRTRGRTLVEPRPEGGHASSKDAVAQVVRLLGEFGFQPRVQREPGGRRIAMRPCPFGVMAPEERVVICPAHLGLVRGALETLGAPLEATSIEPFARPDLCLLHLRQSNVTRSTM